MDESGVRDTLCPSLRRGSRYVILVQGQARSRRLTVGADGEAVYFCGNSLGLLAKKARKHMLEELEVWSTRSVQS